MSPPSVASSSPPRATNSRSSHRQLSCLRCVKALPWKSGLVCQKEPGQSKCNRCSYIGVKCEQVPTRYHIRLLRLQGYAAAHHHARLAAPFLIDRAFPAIVQAFTIRVERHLRRSRLARFPTLGMSSFQRALLSNLGDLNNELALVTDAIHDLRDMPPPIRGEDVDEDEDDVDVGVGGENDVPVTGERAA